TGWLEENGKWYYFNPQTDGSRVTGWFQIDGKQYYFNPQTDASRVTGQVVIDGKTYVFADNGQLIDNTGDVNSSGYQMPINNPNVSSWYGSRWGTVHKGIDFAAAKGTPIMASKSGTVEFAGFGVSGQGFGGYGNVVVIKHGDGRWTLYGHMDSISTTVGAKVQQGQVIGKVGSTGDSTGNHLHFEVKNQFIGGQVDPKPYLPF
ncbi:peptidoglycan DD-metalloendopeptidase family protein, partial [Bacillus cereus]|nr:peptidoglycan DD-metalloendopeptidase family protein [Bacillus cereus]